MTSVPALLQPLVVRQGHNVGVVLAARVLERESDLFLAYLDRLPSPTSTGGLNDHRWRDHQSERKHLGMKRWKETHLRQKLDLAQVFKSDEVRERTFDGCSDSQRTLVLKDERLSVLDGILDRLSVRANLVDGFEGEDVDLVVEGTRVLEPIVRQPCLKELNTVQERNPLGRSCQWSFPAWRTFGRSWCARGRSSPLLAEPRRWQGGARQSRCRLETESSQITNE